MSDNISYDYIWRLYQKERQSNRLLQIGHRFYEDILTYIKESEDSEQQKANMEKLLINLFEKRKQKIFLYATYKRTLPQPVNDREQEFYSQIMVLAETYKLGHANPTNKSNKFLRSLTDIPEIILPSGKKFGPYRKDEIIDLQGSGQDAEYLVKNAICENYNR